MGERRPPLRAGGPATRRRRGGRGVGPCSSVAGNDGNGGNGGSGTGGNNTGTGTNSTTNTNSGNTTGA